jgi:Mannose-1-phosphate guanylyltransferase
MLCALIMAGGKGERFWPLSTDEKPKQFLNLLGEETMIQMTVNRIKELIPIERIFVVTAECYKELVKEQLPHIPTRNIIIEPVGRNTAPCIALSAFMIEKYYKDSTIVVLPSDHLIANESNFRDVLSYGYEYVQNDEKAIVTIGMKPDRPETGYGYIQYGEVRTRKNNLEIRKVERFVEKPDIETAKIYLKEGNFLWNGGMFIWKSKHILNLTKEYLNNTYKILNEIVSASVENFDEVLKQKYILTDSVSVDYAIMEKAEHIQVIPSDFGWDDVGSWNSVERVRDKDESGNVLVGDIKKYNSNNNIIFGNNKPIILAGVSDLFIIESENSIFIGNKDVIDNIKQIKTMINSSN